MKEYPTSVNNSQWQCIKKMLNDKRKRKVSLYVGWDATLYRLKTGCPWRMLPKEFGSWSIVYHYFRKWLIGGVWHRVQVRLRELVRERRSSEASPSLGIIGAQSVRNSEWGIPDKGFDGNKRVKGPQAAYRGGLAGVADERCCYRGERARQRRVIRGMKGEFPRLEKFLGDGGHAGTRLATLTRKT